MKKLRVGILFGGRSGEHEVSLLSAASALNAIDKQKYEVVSTDITMEGRWLTAEHAENLLQGKLVIEPRHLRAGDPETTPAAAVLAQGESVIVPPEPVHRQNSLMPFQRDATLAPATAPSM
jgi:D-alanine-D-alanine ligase